MKFQLTPRTLAMVAGVIFTLGCSPATTFAQGTAFTYHGRLNDGASAANGTYDLSFSIYDAASDGAQQGVTVTSAATPVSNGLFTATLDFGNQFPGANRWLEIAVQTNGGSSFTTLAPRQALTPTPYAITAGSVVSGGLATGTYGNAVTLDNAANNFVGTYSGDGSGLSAVNAYSLNGLTSASFWTLSGNAGADPVTGAFLGTTDNLPLEFKVNGSRALRLEYGSDGGISSEALNVIGGSAANVVSNGVNGALIAGGGAAIYPNRVGGAYASVLGGIANTASGYSSTAMGNSTAVRGDFSTAMGVAVTNNGYASTAMGSHTTVSSDFSSAMGYDNTASGTASTVMGYGSAASGYASTAMGIGNIARGYASTAMGSETIAAGDYSTAGGTGCGAKGVSSTTFGVNNRAFGDYSTALGGMSDAEGASSTAIGAYTSANGDYSLAMGLASQANGLDSTAIGTSTTAEGDYSTAMGFYTHANGVSATAMGDQTTASGNYSMAAGIYANAAYTSSFVWGDSSSGATFSDSGPNQFCIRAQGGVQLDPNTSLFCGSQTRQMLNLWSTEYGIGVQTATTYFRSGNGFAWFQRGVHSNTEDDPGTGGSLLMELRPDGLYVNGTVLSSSDRNAKENFKPVSVQEVLDKVSALPISRWNYKQDTSSEHIGPMAQDFYAAFNVGPDDKHITTIDESGVALAAIQGLNQKLEETRAENAQLKQQLMELKQLVQTLATKH